MFCLFVFTFASTGYCGDQSRWTVPVRWRHKSHPGWHGAECLAACLTWPAQRSAAQRRNAVQVPAKPRAAQPHMTSQLISIDTLIWISIHCCPSVQFRSFYLFKVVPNSSAGVHERGLRKWHGNNWVTCSSLICQKGVARASEALVSSESALWAV